VKQSGDDVRVRKVEKCERKKRRASAGATDYTLLVIVCKKDQGLPDALWFIREAPEYGSGMVSAAAPLTDADTCFRPSMAPASALPHKG